MRIKKEGEDSPPVPTPFDEAMSSMFERYPGLFWLDTRMPKLREVASKVVVLREFDTNRTMGMPWGSLRLQDHSNLDAGGGIERKWEEIVEFM